MFVFLSWCWFGMPVHAGKYSVAGTQTTYGRIGLAKNKAGFQVRLSTSPLRPGESQSVSKKYSIQIGILADPSSTRAAARCWAFYE
jgi:hypothetical protein